MLQAFLKLRVLREKPLNKRNKQKTHLDNGQRKNRISSPNKALQADFQVLEHEPMIQWEKCPGNKGGKAGSEWKVHCKQLGFSFPRALWESL